MSEDICYRGATGSIVSANELEEFKKHIECPECHSKRLLMGLDFGDIGTTIWVICHTWNWKKNITDYDIW